MNLNFEDAVMGKPLAVSEDAVAAMAMIAAIRMIDDSALQLLADPLMLMMGVRTSKSPTNSDVDIIDGIAVVPVSGVLSAKSNFLQRLLGATSYQQVRERFAAAMASDAKVVCLDFASPGGDVVGCKETADAIFAARQSSPKTILAFTQLHMCSAAYFLASQCNEVIATADSQVGSVGVIAKVVDSSRSEKNKGKDAIIVRSGPKKAIGNGPVSDAQVQMIEEMVAEHAQSFYSAVERGREEPVSEDVKSGRIYTGAGALKAGLVDRNMTFAQLLKTYGTKA